MALLGAIHWWEEWQLRILVLGSLLVQWILFLSSFLRRFAIPSWFRSIIWLAYLGSDSLAIYALATLFNRQGKQQDGSTVLEVVWAPVLLMHLGGQDTITAYNIEDNELWRRHVLTAVSQITVAIYVFLKSWPGGGDKRLLQAAILLFVPGVLKCLEKPWALKGASINSLVSSSELAQRTTNREGEINSLQDYVQAAKASVQHADHTRAREEEEINSNVPGDDHPQLRGISAVVSGCIQIGNAALQELWSWQKSEALKQIAKAKAIFGGDDHPLVREVSDAEGETLKLFVDLASPYPNRLAILKSFWLQDDKTHHYLQQQLSNVFGILYTKEKLSPLSPRTKEQMDKLEKKRERESNKWNFLWGNKSAISKITCGRLIRYSCVFLPWAAIGLFRKSHIQGYSDADVKITYALLCCTAGLEVYSIGSSYFDAVEWSWSDMVSQYNLIGFFVRNKKHSKKMCIMRFFGCKDNLNQHWCMKSRSSSRRITILVLRYVKAGWRDCIQDVASYRMFSDHRGQWTLKRNNCNHALGWSIRRPFDESVLLWHIATDFCFYSSDFPGHKCDFNQRKLWERFPHTLASVRIRLRSRSQCGELAECKAVQCRHMSNYMIYLLFVNPEMLLPGTRRNLFTTAYGELKSILKDDDNLPLEKTGLTQRIIAKLQSAEGSKEEGFVQDAWTLAKALRALHDEKKMWEVIEGVWVEMLCFSAGRCRGYLHAKALGTGGELLTYVWLLMSYMGMETLAERMQRTELPSGAGNDGAAAASGREVVTDTAPSTSRFPSGAGSSASEVPTATGAAPSTSEIRMATGEDMV
ncbi:unnamed protein product [Urochloa decumbens]|uniref:DUF4220 domain-containing protein n=1 Tax=Urochloa decumbens TaxID=240449 RepID=A0ABC9G5C4_9POAL